MIKPNQELPEILDPEGWCLGLRAVLKQAFGTDTEQRMQNGTVSEEVRHARKQVGRMSDAAEGLINAMEYKRPIDKVEQALQAIVKDL